METNCIQTVANMETLPVLLLSALVLINTQQFMSEAGLTTRSRRINTPYEIKSQGYYAEVHHVITSDGYILEMHRIPYARNQYTSIAERSPVLIMHGIGAASNSFIILGPEYSIAYNLADAGFDVWLANSRGTRNSRFHVKLDPNCQEESRTFFDFTWEEIGEFDTAAMVDYILEHTGRSHLHYIGHSQGGTAFLVLNSIKPEYNGKFLSAHLLAGVGYQEHFPSDRLASVSRLTDTIYRFALVMGLVELYPQNLADNKINEYDNENIADFCFGDIKFKDLCELIGTKEILEPELQPTEGVSTKQLAHFGQNIRDKAFRRWNYGPQKNLEIYKSDEPPTYDLSLVTVNVTMHYTLNDTLLSEIDVLSMAAKMPNTVARKVARDSFSHTDFVVSNDAKKLVTDYIIESMKYLEKS